MNWKEIQDKWIEKWKASKVFETDPDINKNKFFLTVAYPYPNSPQHIGHGRTYTLTDVYARYKRMQGYQVLFPMAFHYTGTPILAMAERLASNDRELIDTFVNVYNVPKQIIPKLTEPVKIAQYFHQEIKAGMIEIGYSIDWRREFTTIDPCYSKLIQWQFHKLKEKGFITRGSHPVGWCPKDGNPVGQHDTMGDVEPEIGEYTLIKFKFGDYIIPTATLRPETLFGVTNLWINPDSEYSKVEVDGEPWIISNESVQKLVYLSKRITTRGMLLGSELVGKIAINPISKQHVPILPASFVDPNNGTGLVMSVPAHAPYDFQALRDILKSDELDKKNISKELLESIDIPIIIKTKGYSKIPAEEVIIGMNITNQNAPKLEDATQELYRHEFHSGYMAEGTGEYAGLPVLKARDQVKNDLLKKGLAVSIFEIMNQPVICRCGTQCTVKIFENQWFINYSDPNWKKITKKCLDKISLLPEEIRSEFEYTIGWLNRKACARKSGLGTRLPWDEDWIIESLSDSVIYMVYYIISKYVNIYDLKPEQLGQEVIDYILLGEGIVEKISNKYSIDIELLEKIRFDFIYFYPLDSRHSGRDLVPNHLTFFLFNHCAIFPENNWPNQIVVNGSVLMDGKKMSKSYGNIIPLRDAVRQYGADPLRLAILATAELLQDADLSIGLVKTFRGRLERIYRLTDSLNTPENLSNRNLLNNSDRWMISRIQNLIMIVTKALDKLRVREALHNIIYVADQDFNWYLRRNNMFIDENRKSISIYINSLFFETRLRLLAPFAPFVSEEIWEKLGHKNLIANEKWPSSNEELIDFKAEEAEDLLRNLLEDTSNIIKVTKIQPSNIIFYTASDLKWDIYLSALNLLKREKKIDFGSLMKELMKNKINKEKAKSVSIFARKLVEEIRVIPTDLQEKRLRIGKLPEFKIIQDSLPFLEKELDCKVSIYDEKDNGKHDPRNRSNISKPYRPAIFIE